MEPVPSPAADPRRLPEPGEPASPERARRVEAIVLGAIDLADPAARMAYVAASCGGDAALRAEVEGLLRAHSSPGFLSGQVVVAPRVEQAGDRIERYRLLQEIGAGGFGVVWMAEQLEPVSRRVALKIIKLGMDTREVVARFEQERQALAMMDHPNIARVLDAGATASGRPFFVMELVKGMPITRFCDEQQLGTRERLGLFGDLCSAINHAHQKGIIHRDIKPSNVLVTMHGDKAVVKVIDFGIAKATQGRLTDKTLFTRFEQFIGTPAYMSPEQAVTSGLDVDTRSDIYALGILLYELLTGGPPFAEESLVAAGWAEMRRMIREVDPPRPSARLGTMAGEERSTVARARHVVPQELGRLVEPDLDWIVMKAIEKDRARRYETANGLALDIRRFLADEPVSASPPSAGYRFRKFARRHRTALRVAAAFALVLVGATAVSTWLAVRAMRAEQAHRASREVADAERARAEANELRTQAEAAKSARSAKFIQSMLTGLDPAVAAGHDHALLTDILMRAARRAADEFRDQPEIEVEILDTIGHCVSRLGLTPHACELARRALSLGEKAYGPDSPRTARLMTVAATRSLQHGRHAQAEALATRAAGIQRRASGPEHPDTLEATAELGAVLLGVGKPWAAEAALREHLAIARRVRPADDPAAIEVQVHLARAVTAQGRHVEAEGLLREAAGACERTLGAGSRKTAGVMLLLVDSLLAQRKPDEAAACARACLAASRAAHAEHLEAAHLGHRLGRILGQDEEAAVVLRAALEQAWRVAGDGHPLSREIQRDLRSWYEAAGKPEEAAALALGGAGSSVVPTAQFEASFESLRSALRADPTDAHAALDLAARLAWRGRLDEWRATARTILVQVADTAHLPSAERAAKAAMIVPGADREMLAQARKLARLALEHDAGSVLYPWFQFCAALVEFRAGDDAAAEAILARIELQGAYEGLAVVPIYRAMIAARAGRWADASNLLDDAASRMRPLPADARAPLAAGGDHDDLITWLAWNEANAMLRAGK